MSKQEKHSDFVSRDDREDRVNPGGEKDFDGLDGADELLTSFSVGKEIKIGIAVIVALVLVLGAVVVKRMRNTADPQSTTAPEAGLATTEDKQPASPAKEGTFRQDQRPAFAATAKTSRPTVLAALPGPGSEFKKRSSSGEDGTWATTSDEKPKREWGREEGRFPRSPQLMPKVPEAGPADRVAGPLAARPKAAFSGGWETDPNPAASTASLRPADPFRTGPLGSGGPRDATTGSPAVPSAPDVLRLDSPDGAGRSLGPVPPSAESRAPLAQSAANPLRGQGEAASARADGRRASSSPLSTRGSPLAEQDTASRDAPRFGDGGNSRPGSLAPGRSTASELAKSPGLSGRLDWPGTRVPDPSRPAGQLTSAIAPAARIDRGSRPGDESGRRADGTYVVQPSDSFSSISQRLFGSSAYYQALAEHNIKEFPRPDKLQPGDVIRAPSVAELQRLFPNLCPTPDHGNAIDGRARTASTPSRSGGGKVYVVQEGDTLFDIARSELGKASRWSEIYELNKDSLGKQFDFVTPGMQLVLPDGGTSVLSQRSDSGLRR